MGKEAGEESTSIHTKSGNAHVNPHTCTHSHSLTGSLAHSLARSQAPPPHFIACLQLQWELAAERDLSIVVDTAPLEPQLSANRALGVAATLGNTSTLCKNARIRSNCHSKLCLVFFPVVSTPLCSDLHPCHVACFFFSKTSLYEVSKSECCSCVRKCKHSLRFPITRRIKKPACMWQQHQ